MGVLRAPGAKHSDTEPAVATEETPTTRADGKSIDAIRKESAVSKEAHKMSLNAMDDEAIALYVTEGNINNMINPKLLKEVKRACKHNPQLRKQFKTAMGVLATHTEIDDFGRGGMPTNVIDGMAM